MFSRLIQTVFIVVLGACTCWQTWADQQKPDGFLTLFNGRDLSGWEGRGHENPRQYDALSAEARKKKQLVDWTLAKQEFGGLKRKMALEVAAEFFDFVMAQHLTSALQDCDAQHMMTLAVRHAHCLVTSPKPIGVSVTPLPKP